MGGTVEIGFWNEYGRSFYGVVYCLVAGCYVEITILSKLIAVVEKFACACGWVNWLQLMSGIRRRWISGGNLFW